MPRKRRFKVGNKIKTIDVSTQQQLDAEAQHRLVEEHPETEAFEGDIVQSVESVPLPVVIDDEA